MSTLADKLLMCCGGVGATEPLYVDDIFSAWTYPGNASTQSLVTGIDLSTKAGLAWLKGRTDATDHKLYDTIRGATHELISDSTAADATNADTLTAFNADGISLGADVTVNDTSAHNYIGWFFQEADNFFKVAQVVKSSGSNATVDLSSLGVVGMVTVKRTDSTGDWYTFHRSCTSGKLVYLNKTDAEATLGHITVSGTTLTLVDGVIADGTYIVYAWAHDDSAEGLIQCGTFTTDGSGNASVTLGWEPQYLLFKTISITGHWFISDNMRGLHADPDNKLLVAEAATAEESYSCSLRTAGTGFTIGTAPIAGTYIYLAVRRPNKPPTSGTQVYNAIAYTGNNSERTIATGLLTDFVMIKSRSVARGTNAYSRLVGAPIRVLTSGSAAEVSTDTSGLTGFDVMGGVRLGVDSSFYYANHSAETAETYIAECFRRAPGVFDVVCDTGTGSAHTIAHNLTVVPELMIRKKRSAADAWYVYAGDATDYLVLNTTAATADLDTIWNDTAPTSSVFTVGTHDDVNQDTGTFVTYLFATLPGISKVFSVTKVADANLDVDCGFSAGARFVLLKRTDSTGDWYVWDSVRGIVAGDDPYLLLNATGAEVTNTDYIDPLAAGFTIVDNGLADGNYIGLAFA